MVLNKSGTKDFILPVPRLYVSDCAGLHGDRVREQVVVRGVSINLIGGVLAKIHHVIPLIHLLKSEVGVVLDLSAVAPASFGGNENDSVGSAVTIYCRCRGILE